MQHPNSKKCRKMQNNKILPLCLSSELAINTPVTFEHEVLFCGTEQETDSSEINACFYVTNPNVEA